MAPRTRRVSARATGSFELMTVTTRRTNSSTEVTLSSCRSLSCRWRWRWRCSYLAHPQHAHLEEVRSLAEQLSQLQHARVDEDGERVLLEQPGEEEVEDEGEDDDEEVEERVEEGVEERVEEGME